jgi:arginine/ornithine transport system permease protein
MSVAQWLPNIDWAVIVDALPSFFSGLQVSLILLAITLPCGFLLSLALSVIRASSNKFISGPVWLFTYIVRGTPLLVQIFLIYYGLAQFEAVRDSIFWFALKNAWFCAWLAFTINTTAYTTEIFAGAIKATPLGEIEAARSLGMSSAQVYRRILLPGGLRRALPQYSNEVVGMMHATALASTVTLVDLTRVGRDVYANHLLPVEAFGTVAVFYFVLTFSFVGLFKLLEKHFLKHLRPRTA